MPSNWIILSVIMIFVVVVAILSVFGQELFSAISARPTANSALVPFTYSTNVSSVLSSFSSLIVAYNTRWPNASYINGTIGYAILSKTGIYEINLSVSNSTGNTYKTLYLYVNGTLSSKSLPDSYDANFSNASQVRQALKEYAAPLAVLESYTGGNMTGSLVNLYPDLNLSLHTSVAQQTFDGFRMLTTTYTLTKPYYNTASSKGALTALTLKVGRLEGNPNLILLLYLSAVVLPSNESAANTTLMLKALS